MCGADVACFCRMQRCKTLSPLEVTKRPLHGYEYTPLEQCEKEIALKAAARDFPDVNPVWREWVYDYVTKEVGNEEMARRIQSGHYEKK